MKKIMRVFFGCRYGLGDILSAYFCPINYGKLNRRAELLMRLRNACLSGDCNSAFVVSSFTFWEFLDFPLRLQRGEYFDPPLPHNGSDLREVAGHHNLLWPPKELFDFAPRPRLGLPTRRPIWLVPNEYILFSDGAGAADRSLKDPRIVDWLQRFLPVVRIGSSDRHYQLPMGPRSSTSADMDLCNRTDLTEVFWLAKHARVIVSPFTYLRTMSSLVGTPVIELAEAGRVSANTLARTEKEYRGREYGMRNDLNFWYVWADGAAPVAAERLIGQLCMYGCRALDRARDGL
jgi:hypothetical protein